MAWQGSKKVAAGMPVPVGCPAHKGEVGGQVSLLAGQWLCGVARRGVGPSQEPRQSLVCRVVVGGGGVGENGPHSGHVSHARMVEKVEVCEGGRCVAVWSCGR